ncbi:hypothetical protein DFQ14_102542 [Halopolyspora algeriensis]|uniref:Uncharacterized protein n=1 Tax=Halopolyspora algeriensis TaxID=1500506 RepID=A0A368VWL1_9ACTN|nr:hypothetical protein [Halopolyspora algeriensis]RCW46239.1 hypothetical protein DFQ14_102542 [Halopolyspora algeriensis]TQM55642.1 hypothetical protein FHU43_0417 [Halopolyspora algeriensis]
MSEPPESEDPSADTPEDPRRLPDDGLGQSPELETIDLDGDEPTEPAEQDEDTR